MKTKNIFIAMTLLCGMLVSCESTPEATPKPSWVDDPKSMYNENEYIARVGEGFTKKEALADAELQMGKYFGQHIESITKSSESWRQSTDHEFVASKNLDKEYTITFDVNLFSLSKGKPWYDADTGSWYICAYLNRDEAYNLYKSQIQAARKDFYSFYTQDIDKTDKYLKLDWLESTNIIGQQYLEVLNFAQTLKPDVYKIFKGDFEKISQIKSEFKQLELELSKRPSWVNTPEQDYPSSKFIARIGQGDTPDKAMEQAEKELGKYFGQNIKSNVYSSEVVKQANGKTSIDLSMINETSVTSDVTLFGVEKTTPWYNPKNRTYYVLAYLDRAKTIEFYKPAVDMAKTEFYNLYNNAVAEPDIFKKINLFEQSKAPGKNYQEILDDIVFVYPASYTAYKKDYDAIASIDSKINDAKLISKSISIKINNNYGKPYFDFFSRVLSDNGFTVSNARYQYILAVDIDDNLYEGDLLVAEPTITITLKNKVNNEVIYTYNKSLPKIKAHTQNKIDRTAKESIENELNQSFEAEFTEFFDSQL